jgi:hypothetical protein
MMAGLRQDSQPLALTGRFVELEEALCRRVAGLREPDPLLPITVVVGSSLVRLRIGDLLVRRLGAVANVSIITLSRLAARLAAWHGVSSAALPALARERLVRLLCAQTPPVGYFGPVRDRPHFPAALAATFSDLRQGLVEPDSGWERCLAAASGGSAPAAKAVDLSDLYAGYCAELDRRDLYDDAAVHVAAARAAATAPQWASSVLGRTILYGIYDVNGAQECLVRALLDAGADLFTPSAGADLFMPSAAAGRAIERRRPSADHEAVAVLLDGATGRSAAPPHACAGTSWPAGDGTLTVVSVTDERGQAVEAARIVLAAVAAGAPPWECAVIVPHGDDAERIVTGLRSAGLSVAGNLPDRPIGARVLLRLADCLAPVSGVAFGRRAVIDLLSAAPLRDQGGGPLGRALWLDEARRAGVLGGLEQWTERLGRACRGLRARVAEREATAAGHETAGDQDDEQPATLHLRLAAATGLEAAVAALAGACGGLPDKASWGEWAAALGAAAEQLYHPDAAAGVRDAAARLQLLDVLAEQVDRVEMASVLREQLAGARAPVGRVGRDGVAVLTPLEMRGLSFGTVVFTGLAEGGFPTRGRPDPILGDADRRRVAEALKVRLPLAEERVEESLLLFRLVCEGARDRLVLMAPRTDAATGRPRLPSRLLLHLASLAAGRPVGLDEFLSGRPLWPVWRHVAGPPACHDDGSVTWIDARERDTAVLIALDLPGGADACVGYLGEVFGDEGASARRLAAWSAARTPVPGSWDGLLGGPARAALAALHPFDTEMHPTRLERYVGCPFAFYLHDVLGLEVPEEPAESLEMEARDFGSLAHDILQRAFERLMQTWPEDGPPEAEAVQGAIRDAWHAGCAAAERHGVTGAALAWEVRRAMLLEDLLEAARRDPVFRHGGGRPLAVEWSFGEAVERPVALTLADGRRIRFAGRADRIDKMADGARVIDYKTGKGGAEQELLGKGIGVQLPVYRLAVRQAWGSPFDVIACQYRLVTRRGGFAEVPLDDDEGAAAQILEDLVAVAVRLVDEGLFPRVARKNCDYCDLQYACGTSAWTRDRKREHPLLADVVGLQSAGPQGVMDSVGR